VSVVVVGDQRAGKSSLIDRFIWNDVSAEYKPTSFDKFSVKKIVNEEEISFTVWDTSGSQAYDSVRPLSYNEADIFMLCFSVADPRTLNNVRNHWIQEIRRHRPDAPVLLCGCMARLRDDMTVVNELRRSGLNPVTPNQAMQICSEIGISIYVDTSAKEGLKEVLEAFDMAAILTLQHRADRDKLEYMSNLEEERARNASGGRSAAATRPVSAGGRSGSDSGRPGSAGGRPGSAASCGRSGSGASSQGTNHRRMKTNEKNSLHGSYSNIPGPLAVQMAEQMYSLDLFNKTAPVHHKQTRSLDSPAGETIHEDEIFDSSSNNGTRSPRSLQKKSDAASAQSRGGAGSPAFKQHRSLSPTTSLPSSPGGRAPPRPSLGATSPLLEQGAPLRTLEQGAPLRILEPLRTTQSQQFQAENPQHLHFRSISQPLQESAPPTSSMNGPPTSNSFGPPQFNKQRERNGRNDIELRRQQEFTRQTSSVSQPEYAPRHSEFTRQISNVSQEFGEMSRGGRAESPDLDLRTKPPERNSQKSNHRTSLPAGRPPLPVATLPKSPSDLNPASPITQEPAPNKRRLAHLGVPDPKNYESLKSHTSTVSHGSTGSKLSAASSLSGNGPLQYYSGPRDYDIPDTEDPEILKKLDFVSPKAGVYRPANPQSKGSKKDKCSLM